MTTASEDAGLTKTQTEGQRDADKSVEEAERALAAAKAVQADEERQPDPTPDGGTPAPDAVSTDASTTTEDAATTEDTSDDVLANPTVAELAEAANTLRAATQTRVAAFLDHVSEALIKQADQTIKVFEPEAEDPLERGDEPQV